MEKIITVDYLLDLFTRLHNSGNGDMEIKCLDNPLHVDEININYTKNEMTFKGYIFNFPITEKVKKFCSDIEKAEEDFYKNIENGKSGERKC